MIRSFYPQGFRCLSCAAIINEALETGLPGVTSDLKPWPHSGCFSVCSRCGHVQKLLDQDWNDDVSKIYGQYEMYSVSGGEEQRIFDNGLPLPRSMKLVENLRQTWMLPSEGKILDFGCGNGAFLRSFSRLFSEWKLNGFDLDSRFADALSHIEKFYELYGGSLAQIEEFFDLITMVYVIEHLTNPRTILEQLRCLLKAEGALLVQTSSFDDNPFDLMVVDHCSHFSEHTLSSLVVKAGFSVARVTQGWIAKEIGLIAVPVIDGDRSFRSSDFVQNQSAGLEGSLKWLEKVVLHAKSVGMRQDLGIFGTAIAGTWLANALGDKFSFFLDEDPSRIGRTHLGRPIRHPTEVKSNSSAYLAFPWKMAKTMHERLAAAYPTVNFLLPPANEP